MTVKERNEQLQQFIDLANTQRALYKGCPKNVGITLDSVIQASISMETIAWLSHNHYIAVHKDKPIWVAWENKYYPDRTISNLQKWLKKYEENKK